MPLSPPRLQRVGLRFLNLIPCVQPEERQVCAWYWRLSACISLAPIHALPSSIAPFMGHETREPLQAQDALPCCDPCAAVIGRRCALSLHSLQHS